MPSCILLIFGNLRAVKLDKECFRISWKVMAKVSSLGVSSFITQIAIVLVMAIYK